jgi:hypothetical protein
MDGFAVKNLDGSLTAYQPGSQEESGSTVLNQRQIQYSGMDKYNPVGGTNSDRSIVGSIFDRNLILRDANPTQTGRMRFGFVGLTFEPDLDRYEFDNPSNTLLVDLGTGDDSIAVLSLDSAFSGSLITYARGDLRVDLASGGNNTVKLRLPPSDDPEATAQSIDEGLELILEVGGREMSFGTVAEGVMRATLNGNDGNDSFYVEDVVPQFDLTIIGGSGTDTVFGSNDGMEWEITSANGGSADGIRSFSGIENLTGGTGEDDFIFRSNLTESGTISGIVDAGGGNDTIVGPDIANEWTINGPNTGTLTGRATFQNMESVVGGLDDDTFVFSNGGTLTGLIDGGIEDTDAPAVNTIDFGPWGAGVRFHLPSKTVRSLDGVSTIAPFDRVERLLGSTLSGDAIDGPDDAGVDVPWVITSPDAGEIATYSFSQIENLVGNGLTNDSFLFESNGSLSGTLHGGDSVGTYDQFAVDDGTTTSVFAPTQSGSGEVVLQGKTIRYSGIDASAIVSGTPEDVTLRGSAFADDFTLSISTDPDTLGQLFVEFDGTQFTSDGVTYEDSATLPMPTGSLSLFGLAGGDNITIRSLGDSFQGDLLIYGNVDGFALSESDAASDNVIFDGNIYTNGGYLEAFGDNIEVTDGSILSTAIRDPLNPTAPGNLSDGNDIVFRARRISTPDLVNLTPVGYVPKSVEIRIGTGAKVYASSIYLIAQAEDRTLEDQFGIPKLASDLIITPAIDFLSNLVALPIKILVKSSKSEVILEENAELLADNVVGIYSVASAESTGQAVGSVISVGYTQSDVTSTIDIQDGVKIRGNGPINITSDGTSIASISSEAEREKQRKIPGNRKNAFAASLGISHARLTSTTTVAPTAEIYGGRTVNVRALGTTESEADVTSGLFADGTASLAIGIQLSFADVLTKVDGKVTADMSTNGGEVVKFEFDPTVAASDYTSDESVRRVAPRDTVKLVSDMQLDLGSGLQTVEEGTVLMYMGEQRRMSVNLGSKSSAGYEETFVNADGDTVPLWTVSSEPWGYVDYDKDRIAVYNLDNEASNWVVVTEDTIDYSARRGNSIPGLDPGTYYIVQLPDNPDTATDESRYIKLARSERDAILAYLHEAEFNTGTNINVVNLGLGADPDVSTNKNEFTAAGIVDDKITLDRSGTVFNAFELGQAVIYREPGRTDSDKVVEDENGNLFWQSQDLSLDGTPYTPLLGGGSPDWMDTGAYLVHGGLYYVMAGVDQFNLIGDSRLVNEQVIQLGALENETRGGIARIKIGDPVDPTATGFTLAATHIMDSTFLTFGIGSLLNATDTVSVGAGFTRQKLDKPKDKDKGYEKSATPFENLFNFVVGKYASKASSGGANGNATLQVAGGVAFSYTEHDVQTIISGTADLNSNDDMELTSAINESLSISAESDGATQKDKKKKYEKKGADGKVVTDSSGNAVMEERKVRNASAKDSVSAAIAVGIVNNTSKTTIESGAELDSMRALRVLSGVTYPFLTRPDEFVPLSASELSDSITSDGIEAVTQYLNPSEAIRGLFNTWTRSQTRSDGMAIAGSINVLVFSNTAESKVETGVIINQDPFYRPDPRFYLQPGDAGYDPNYDPAVDNDNITHSRNANNVDEHVVSIEATNYMQFLNMTGVFGFDPKGKVKSKNSNGIDGVDIVFDPRTTTANGGSGGVGGALIFQFLTNTTHAIVEPGVILYSGKNSGLNIKPKKPS